MSGCIDTPISWLRLERFHLGEIGEDDRAAIVKHLAACPTCAACLRSIEDDTRALPPLDRRAPRNVVVALRRAAPILGALAVAAGVIAVVGRGPKPLAEGTRVKGNEIGFSLVRADDVVFAEAGALYRDGDSFKALVSCPPGHRGGFDVVVYERGEAAFPLEPQTELACGNGIALPGAFRLTGQETMIVCVVWNEAGAVDREAIRRTPPDALTNARCKTVDPNR